MRLYRVGLIGHSPDRFRNPEAAKELCRKTILDIQYQYDDYDSLYFNLDGAPGSGQWAGDNCIDLGVKYNLFLPFTADLYSQHWFDDQQKTLQKQIEMCSGLTLLGTNFEEENIEARNQMLVQQSDFIICLWEGRLQGDTFKTIKYAVENSKIVLNALADMSMVSRKQLEVKNK